MLFWEKRRYKKEKNAMPSRNYNLLRSEVAWETTFDVLSCDMMGS